MAIPWLAVLKIVPWTEVINNAPKVAEGAKKLWSAVGKKPPAAVPFTKRVERPFSGDVADIGTLQARIESLEATAAEAHQQMLASSELIKTLADQNTQLIKRIETHRIRLAWLAAATAVIAVVVLVVVLGR